KFLAENKHEDVSMIGCNAYIYFEENNTTNKHPLSEYIFKKKNIITIHELTNEIKMPSSTFFKYSNIYKHNISFKEKINYCEDALFSVNYLSKCRLDDKITFLNQSIYNIRKRVCKSSTQDGAAQDKKFFIDALKYNIFSIFDYGNSVINENYAFSCLIYNIRAIFETNSVVFTSNEQYEYLDLLDSVFLNINRITIENFSKLENDDFYKAGIINCFKKEIPLNYATIEKVDIYKKLIIVKYFTNTDDSVESIKFDGREAYADNVKLVKYNFLDRVFIYEKRLYLKVPEISYKVEIFINGIKQSIKWGIKYHYDFLSTKWIYNKIELLNFKSKNKYLWLLMDRDYEADDNAEHLYRYIMQNHPEQKIIFALRKESSDWNRLKQEGFNLVECYSKEFYNICRQIVFFISSHTPLTYGIILEQWQKFIFLGHGTDSVDISRWFNTLNIDCRTVSTVGEKKAISCNKSSYKLSLEEVVLTGQARHDKLLKGNKIKNKKITIMPTWRQYLTIKEDEIKRKINKDFISSEYFCKWQSFLKNNVLKKLSLEYGYSILFCPHYNMINMLKYFNVPDYIQIGYRCNNESFQKIFQESDLMITDYSSAAFEMAYVNKAVIYYQFDKEEFFSNHTYRQGWFDYEENGFGPVVATEEDLINELEKLLKNDCKVAEPYKSNIKNTFAFKDGKCCERIYKAILELNRPYERKYTLDYVLTLANNAFNKEYFNEASQRYKYVLEHLEDKEFIPHSIKLNEELIFNYLYSSRINNVSDKAIEFINAQNYENIINLGNKTKLEIIKNYISIDNVYESVQRLKNFEIPKEEQKEFTLIQLKAYFYLGCKDLFKKTYEELQNTYNISEFDLRNEILFLQNELIKDNKINNVKHVSKYHSELFVFVERLNNYE
ncbi:CDP-glycerol glycerophosphotransferase family protein, partial [Campylobacter canadensis]